MSLLKCFKRTRSAAQMMRDDIDEIDKAPNSQNVSCLDLSSLIYTIIFHFVDVGFDLYVAYSYYVAGNYSYFSWTVAFILIPTIIITFISINMYVEDSKNGVNKCSSYVRIILCILGIPIQSALLIRYCDSFWLALKSIKAKFHSDKSLKEKYFNKMLNEDSDVALLRVFESYLESAPQQVLQITLFVLEYSQGSYIHTKKQCITIVLGFIGMGWCMANYHRCIRFDQEDKFNISAPGVIVQFFWHLTFTVSRIVAISALATLYPFWTCISVVVHWCVMTVWIAVTSKTAFCGKHKILEMFFAGAVGSVYIFNFLSLNDGPTKNFYIVYYFICFVENITCSGVWWTKSTPKIENWIFYIFAVFPILFFIFSVIFLVVYYRFLHPNKLKSNKSGKKVFYGNSRENCSKDQKVTLSQNQNTQD